jgi:hypothetical protein
MMYIIGKSGIKKGCFLIVWSYPALKPQDLLVFIGQSLDMIVVATTYADEFH